MQKQTKLKYLIFFYLNLCLWIYIPIAYTQTESVYHQGKAYSLIKYDGQLYTMAYNTFIANDNLQDAYLVAEAAVKQRPNDLEWRKKLAQVSVWMAKGEEAFQQYYFIAQKEKSQQAIAKAYEYAKNFNAHIEQERLLELEIARDPANIKAIEALIALQEKLGNTGIALGLLKQRYEATNNPAYLKGIAQIYAKMGDKKKALEAYQALTKYKTLGPDALIENAKILYQLNEYDIALKLLRDNEARLKDKVKYWQTVGNLAWLLQDKALAAKAYEQLYNRKVSTIDDNERLIMLLREQDPQKAYDIAKASWSKQKDLFLALTIMDLASQQRDWNYLSQLYSQIPESILEQAQTYPFFWSTKANSLDKLGRPYEAREVYLFAINKFPENLTLQIDYLYFLIEENNPYWLRQTLTDWRDKIWDTPGLWQAGAYGYLRLGLVTQALVLYSHGFPLKYKDILWLSQFAVALEDADHPKIAYRLQMLAWEQLKTIPVNPNPQIARAFAELAYRVAPGDIQAYAAYLNYVDKVPDYKEVIIAYALRTDNSLALARYVRHILYFDSDKVPGWADLYVALFDYDMPRMQYLLDTKASRLPHRDRVQAAVNMGHYRRGIALAYQGLLEHPQDAQLYQQFVGIMENYSNKVWLRQFYEKQGVIEGPHTIAKFRIHITPRLAFAPTIDVWSITRFISSELNNVPQFVNRFEGNFLYWMQRGTILFGGGYAHGAEDYPTARIDVRYRLYDRLTSQLLLGYNTESRDSEGLRVAGTQQEARLRLNYLITAHDIWFIQGRAARFTDQRGNYLGNGLVFFTELDHKFFIAYPDYTAGLFFDTFRYRRSNNIPPNLFRFFPAGTAAGTSPFLFVPVSFSRYGARLFFGNRYYREYTNEFRPYASAAIFWNTNQGLGYEIDTGVATSVFGRDHLAIYFNQGTNAQEANQTNRQVGVNYTAYFN
ncbi:MAG: tetratricopeptide repeat protein [Pseudomonadota bacterium]